MPLKVVPIRDRKLHRLVKRAPVRSLRRREPLYEAGDPADTLVLVRRGHLRLTLDEEGGGFRAVAVVGPWELTGEEGLVPGSRRRTGARAGETAQIQRLDGASVARALRTAERTLDSYLLAKGEEEKLARILGGPRRAGGAALRVGSVLLDLARRLGRLEEKGARIPISLTHQLLADLSGTHRSTVTTLLNDWIYEGLLRDDPDGLRILGPEALRARIGSVDPKST